MYPIPDPNQLEVAAKFAVSKGWPALARSSYVVSNGSFEIWTEDEAWVITRDGNIYEAADVAEEI